MIPNQVLDAQEAEQAKAEAEAKKRQKRPVITSLAGYVRDCWEAAKEAKQSIEREMIDSLRRRNGIYPPDKLAQIREQGGSEIFMMLTDEKCSAVTSWLADLLFPAGDKPWGTKPTPVPELNQAQLGKIQMQVQQEFMQEIIAQLKAQHHAEVVQAMQSGQIQTDEQAKQFFMRKAQEMFDPNQINQMFLDRAEEIAQGLRMEMEKAAKNARDRIETKLHDVVIEANWEDAVHETLDDITTFKAGITKGPVLRRKKKLKWAAQNQMVGADGMDAGFQGAQNAVVEVVEEVSMDFNRVSPFDIYPLPNARKPEDGIIERHRLTRKYLTSLIGVKGYDDDAIRMVLQEYGQAGQSTWLSITNDHTRQGLENRPNEWRSPEALIDALQFWGNVQGLKLLQYGMTADEIEDPFADYAVEVWLIGNYVIKAEINGDPLGRVPYHFASFRKRNGSIWGAGVPEIIKDSQDACNAAARAMINNMGISSGPQVIVDVSQLPPGENITNLYPWKIWQVNSMQAMGANAQTPLSFFMPPSVAGELMQIYQHHSSEADNKTGIPKYTYGGGESKGGALGTATGFSMMMGNATRGIKNVIRNIDNGIIKPSIERTHEFQLLFFNDPEYHQGDIKIIARGSTAMVAKEQAAVRRNELLQIVVGSPAVLNIVGETGLASMLREIFKAGDFKDDDIVPEKREMLQREQAAAQQQQLMMAQQEQMNQQTDPAGNVAGGRDARTV
ncbi:portal protein [Desulfobacter sp.]|uniref:portal protein n=1 Tax=Desulfobacter sp. TaxID=2294 RepID=UPI003D10428A